ncbi:hypothetical protein GD1_8 [Paraglaciecola Antarctic GD virus 1]|nr:hypothetical protein GD1_8 [Paraglaciecola Antarctic GD virus 1]
MKSYQEFLVERAEVKSDGSNLSEVDMQIHAIAYLASVDDVLVESEDFLVEGLNDYLGKIGLKVHKAKGLIDYAKDFLIGTGKLFLLIIKGDKEQAKELLKTVKKEDVLDFLYKLDLATLHLVTGPIHFIDAVTGWDLAVKTKTVVKSSTDLIKELVTSLIKVKDHVGKVLSGKRQKRALNGISTLEDAIVPKGI